MPSPIRKLLYLIGTSLTLISLAPLPVVSQDAGQFVVQDPRADNRFVSRRSFADSLIRKLGFKEPETEHSQDSIKFLSGEKSIDIKPADYVYAAPNIREGTTLVSGTPKPFLYARSAAAPVIYQFSTRRSGETLVSAKITGGSQVWSIDGKAPVPVRAGPGGEAAESPPIKLGPGLHQLRVTLPPGGTLADIRVDTPCIAPILPPMGGPADQPVTYGEKTVSMVRALGLTNGLPNQPEAPATFSVSDTIQNRGATRPVGVTNEKGQAMSGLALNRTGPGSESGRMSFILDLKRAGVYQVSAMVSGTDKASWYTNGCRAESTPVRTADNNPQYVVIGTMKLERGPNRITMQGGPNLKVFNFSLQRKKEDIPSYYAVASAAGLQEGKPSEPVDEGGLNANIRNVLLTEKAQDLRSEERDEMSDDASSLLVVENDAPGLGEFQLGDDSLFDVPVSPFIPAAGLP